MTRVTFVSKHLIPFSQSTNDLQNREAVFHRVRCWKLTAALRNWLSLAFRSDFPCSGRQAFLKADHVLINFH